LSSRTEPPIGMTVPATGRNASAGGASAAWTAAHSSSGSSSIDADFTGKLLHDGIAAMLPSIRRL
jgi:hypothetical protein